MPELLRAPPEGPASPCHVSLSPLGEQPPQELLEPLCGVVDVVGNARAAGRASPSRVPCTRRAVALHLRTARGTPDHVHLELLTHVNFQARNSMVCQRRRRESDTLFVHPESWNRPTSMEVFLQVDGVKVRSKGHTFCPITRKCCALKDGELRESRSRPSHMKQKKSGAPPFEGAPAKRKSVFHSNRILPDFVVISQYISL